MLTQYVMNLCLASTQVVQGGACSVGPTGHGSVDRDVLGLIGLPRIRRWPVI